MFLGLDLGTSGLKALLSADAQRPLATTTVPLTAQRPHPGWSEQEPEAWWQATLAAIDQLHRSHPAELAATTAIGLAGQMHGAVCLGADGQPLRPAILWNDTRAAAECAALEAALPTLRQTAGNIAMPGFTAPKLLWLRHHEPDIFRRTATVLLPKAYLRDRLSGERIEDLSDASGTLWLNVAARAWSDAALAATGLSRAHMPALAEGNAPAGQLRPDLAARWGMTRPPLIAAGAGDNAAGAIGLSAIHPGDAFVSLGTSGVVFVTTDGFRPYPQSAVHAFCHALPNTWHQMGVTLSAAASLAWWSQITGQPEAALLAELPEITAPSPTLFLPYLAGERTPHNDAALRGAFTGLSTGTARADLTHAILDGVAFSLRDCLDALAASGTRIESAGIIGGGARSPAWLRIIAAALGIALNRLPDAEHGVALGAARLARMAATGEPPATVCPPPAILETILPDPALAAAYAARLPAYRAAAGVI
ncbi:MAG: xylulokinase [Acetobacteraceae bacterium]|nr:xylulokinase [Acetobacteraceae bacterium]